ncbi:MAG: TniQ family protein [Calothrix sp. FI2-JRJ7]|jgi:hypothetical protein|nr:TniQ family protein [Calothrix sp. FI2-JRJ7]
MLSFFPIFYSDELLYSALARYHIRSGNKSFRQTDLELFGYSSQQVSKITLTNNLNYLVKNLSFFYRQTFDVLLQNHTLYPFYATFLTPQEAWLLKDSMKKKLSGSILEVAKVATNSTGDSRKFLKFCPTCLKEDEEKYGEPYWHRLHQIPGVLVCSEHSVPLLDSSIPIESKATQYHSASLENCDISISVIHYTDSTLEKLLNLVKDIEWLQNRKIEFKGLAWLRKKYQSCLISQGYISLLPGNKIVFDEQVFFDRIFDFYGKDFLDAIDLNLCTNRGKYFKYCLLGCDINPVIDRVTHILLVKFITNNFIEFFRS